VHRRAVPNLLACPSRARDLLPGNHQYKHMNKVSLHKIVRHLIQTESFIYRQRPHFRCNPTDPIVLACPAARERSALHEGHQQYPPLTLLLVLLRHHQLRSLEASDRVFSIYKGGETSEAVEVDDF